ncbi:endonuclease domain-containing protein [Leucobacter luti]|uniref:endonuclease domain-containing protein n=1 Tax=Leucobacter luti TaxID=340320 RepID=UPI001300891B|nr:DUF559 domain-containing protein [Leucobacter luti]
MVSPVQAFLQSAALLPFRELVVAADHLILGERALGIQVPDDPVSVSHASREPSRLTLAELQAAARGSRTRGVQRARAALLVARCGAESRMETLLRLVLIAYGLDVFELQVDVVDSVGRWIGRFDMVDHQRKLIVEYDGEHHRTSDSQYRRDAVRLDAARDTGFRVLRFLRDDVIATPRATARRVASALGMPLRPPGNPLARYLSERDPRKGAQ